MIDARLITRFENQERGQRWLHVGELAGEAELELVSWIDGVPHTVIASAPSLRSRLDDAAGIRDVARRLDDVEPPGSDERLARAGDDAPILLVDLTTQSEPGAASGVISDAVRAARRVVVWTRASAFAALEPLLVGAGADDLLEQVSVEGALLVPSSVTSVAVDVDVAQTRREGDSVVIACVNVPGDPTDAAARVANVEGGSERLHLATALHELRRANATLGKAQRGKSMAAPAMFIRRAESRITEERQRNEKEERDAWVAGLEDEVEQLRRRVANTWPRRGWRLARRLASWRPGAGRR